jgi:putative MATE family efflux protein
MKDMTQGSVTRHLVQMASFLVVSMLVQTLYVLADLYWVGRLGKEAIAAIGVAGNLMMIVIAATQALSVGTTTLISQAIGRKDQTRAELAFNQSLVMSFGVGLFVGAAFFAVREAYTRSLSADALTAQLAGEYLLWFIPALMLQFPFVALSSALRATGIVKPAVGLQVLSVILNIVLAPMLIFGLGPLPKLGVSGAALATFISILVANLMFVVYYQRHYRYLRVRAALLSPQLGTWWSMLRIGIPAGAEFALLSVYIAIVYAIIRQFGTAAQAGFGVGARVMQSLFLPVIALSFAVAPLVGQNFGGKRADRVRQTAYSAFIIATVMMVLLTIVTQLAGARIIQIFSGDPAVIAFGSDYLKIISFNFVFVGFAFTTSSVFQGIGDTLPPLASSVTRLFLFALPAILLSRLPGFEIRHVWYLSVASVIVQACANLLLLRRKFRSVLVFPHAGTLGNLQQV